MIARKAIAKTLYAFYINNFVKVEKLVRPTINIVRRIQSPHLLVRYVSRCKKLFSESFSNLNRFNFTN